MAILFYFFVFYYNEYLYYVNIIHSLRRHYKQQVICCESNLVQLQQRWLALALVPVPALVAVCYIIYFLYFIKTSSFYYYYYYCFISISLISFVFRLSNSILIQLQNHQPYVLDLTLENWKENLNVETKNPSDDCGELGRK